MSASASPPRATATGPSPTRGRRFPLRLSTHIARELLKNFFLIFIILEAIHGTVFTFQAVRDYGFDLVLFLPIFWRTFAYALYHTIPISLLCASTLVFGRLIADREISALRSFGISHLQMLAAPAVLGLLFSILGFLINGYLVPEIRFAKRNLGKLILDQLQYLGDGWNKSFLLEKNNSLLIERYKDRKLYGIFLFAEDLQKLGIDGIVSLVRKNGHGSQGAQESERTPEQLKARSFPFVLHASEGEVVTRAEKEGPMVALELRDVNIFYDVDLPKRSSGSDFLNRITISKIPIPIQFDDRQRTSKDMPNPMLEREIEDRAATLERVRAGAGSSPEAIRKAEIKLQEARAEFHHRIAFGLISLSFPMTAALIALVLNSTNRLLPFFVGVSLCTSIYFSLDMLGDRLVPEMWPPWLVNELGNLALAALGLGLLAWLEGFPLRAWRRSPAARLPR